MLLFPQQRATFAILCGTNCAGVGVLAPLGHNVQRFKTRKSAPRFSGLPQGMPFMVLL